MSHSSKRVASTPCVRTPIVLAAGAALLPVVFALVIVITPAVSIDSRMQDAGETAFVLDTSDHEAIPDSLRRVLERSERLRRLFLAEESFLLAQQSVARAQSTSLAVDLRDSVAVLSIEGVPIRTSRILGFRRSLLFERLSEPDELLKELETPFTLTAETATIPRIPMRVVQAPKDTTEAQLRPPDAFVADDQDVYAELHFDRNVTLYLIPISANDSWFDRGKGGLKRRGMDALKAVSLFFEADDAPPERWIRLEMPSNDIRAIYRALPDGGKMAIRW